MVRPEESRCAFDVSGWLTATMAADASTPGLQNRFIVPYHPSCTNLLRSTIFTSLVYGFVDDCGLESWYCIFVCHRNVFSRYTRGANMELIQLWFLPYFSNIWFVYLLPRRLLYGTERMAWYWHLILSIFHLTINWRHLDIYGCFRYPQGGMT